VYDEFRRIEEAFNAALDDSLRPRSPELLYEIVQGFDLPEGSLVLDVGCGDGRHSYRLAERFGFSVVGIDPNPPHVEATRQVRLVLGVAEALPVEDRTADLVWCRDVLVHVADLDRAYAEFHRVLRDGGRALVYQMFATDRLEPREAEWLWRALGLVDARTDPARTEAAIVATGLRVDERIDLTSEWGEWSEERWGAVGRSSSTRPAWSETRSGIARGSATRPTRSCSATASVTCTRCSASSSAGCTCWPGPKAALATPSSGCAGLAGASV
jgi:SAM-dependent methyltransferase